MMSFCLLRFQGKKVVIFGLPVSIHITSFLGKKCMLPRTVFFFYCILILPLLGLDESFWLSFVDILAMWFAGTS